LQRDPGSDNVIMPGWVTATMHVKAYRESSLHKGFSTRVLTQHDQGDGFLDPRAAAWLSGDGILRRTDRRRLAHVTSRLSEVVWLHPSFSFRVSRRQASDKTRCQPKFASVKGLLQYPTRQNILDDVVSRLRRPATQQNGALVSTF